MRRRLSTLAEALLLHRQVAVYLFQAALIIFSLVLAWLLRFDFSLTYRNILFLAIPVLLPIRLVTMRLFRLHHGWWQYSGVNEILDIFKSVALGSILFFLTIRFGFGMIEFPRSVYFIEAILTAATLGGIRVFSRVLAESVRDDLEGSKQVIIVGAGFAAQMLLREISRQGSGYKAVGCVDDDPHKSKIKVMGIPVLGDVESLPRLTGSYRIDEVLIAIPSATSSEMRRIVDVVQKSGVKFRTVPALRDFLLDDRPMSQLREVNLDDLLGREPVKIDLDAVRSTLTDKVVLITGAAGSIGSELCRQVLDFGPRKLVCLDQDETASFFLENDLKSRGYSDFQVVIGDVADKPRMRRLLLEHGVNLVSHAAAYKHVPMMERNVQEAVRNNVLALLSLMDAAQESHCEGFVLISSDKAVNPTNVMGATKRICELVLASRPSNGMRCVAVRFGNVLGSNGSLIPILQEQIRTGKPLTITHPEIRRFFMTTQEAVSLVLQASSIGRHGDILVLDMGDSIKILDIAKTLINLSGKKEQDVPIVFTGLRDGEKFYEELFYDSEKVTDTEFNKIKRAESKIADWSQMRMLLHALAAETEQGNAASVRHAIKSIVAEYSGVEEIEASYSGAEVRAAQR